LMVAGGLAGGSAKEGVSGAGQGVLQGGSEALLRAFLQERQAQESAADQAGMTLLGRTGQSGVGMLETFERLAEDNRSTSSDGYRRTHPLEKTRIALLREAVQKSPYTGVKDPPDLQIRHDMVRAKLTGYLRPAQEVMGLYPATNTSMPARYARAIARLRQISTLAQGVADIDSLIKDKPTNAYFYEVKGDFLMKGGKNADAIAPLRKAIELLKTAPQLETMLARAMIQSGDPQMTDDAIVRLKTALRSEDEADKAAGSYLDTYRMLSQAYGAKNQIAEANLMQAEVEVRIGNYKIAKERAAIALRDLKSGSPAWLRADDIVNLQPPKPPQ
jgi:predicted Zn-dependent protease